MRIAVWKDWHDDLEHVAGNQDGLLAAIAVLSARHNVTLKYRSLEGRNLEFTKNGIYYVAVDRGQDFLPDNSPDVILCWGSLDRPWHSELPPEIPALLCFAGGPTDHPNLKNFKHVFVESQVYLDDFLSRGISCSRAFGTNTEIFRPEPRTPKILDALYPASFCRHKNHETFSRAVGSRGLAVGHPDDLDLLHGACHRFGTPTLAKVSSRALADLYNLSRVTVIPNGPNGGSQRTCLESLACGVPVLLADDNDKCREFILESGFGALVPPVPEAIREALDTLISAKLDPAIGRSYIMSKWTHHHYADNLEAELRKWQTPTT